MNRLDRGRAGRQRCVCPRGGREPVAGPGGVDRRASHINERRTAINAARTRNGLAAATWTDATLTPGSTAIKAVHIAELRAALNAIFTKLGKTLPSYTDATIVSGQTTAKAVHIQELRNALGVLP